MSIIGACVVYNNQHIFHKPLETFRALCDKIIIVDDCSGFFYKGMIQKYYNKNNWRVYALGKKTKKEIERRSKLWNLICEDSTENDWIVLLDSDESYHEKDWKHLLDLMNQYKNDDHIRYIATRLYNMWSETEYRIDGYWNPKFELKRRIFKLKKGDYVPRNFNPNIIECGEVPSYVFGLSGINTECKLLHWGYVLPKERQRKYEFHKKVDPEGKFHLSSHIDSIIQKPTLTTLT